MSIPRLRSSLGFTLIELMIAAAILAILVAIALPSYREYLLRGYRAEAQNGLIAAAAAMERCYSQAYTYVGCAVAPETETGLYAITLDPDTQTATTYLLTAARLAPQALVDERCGDWTLNAAGERGHANAEENCW